MASIFEIAERIQNLQKLFHNKKIENVPDDVLVEAGEVAAMACGLAALKGKEYMMLIFSDFLIEIVQEITLNRTHLNKSPNKHEFNKAFNNLMKANQVLFDQHYDCPDDLYEY
jgi:hypothetical protein